MGMARTRGGVGLAALAALLIAAPATAQEPPEEGADGVTCEPANPAPASTTDCTASGLAPSSAFEWSAQFTDGSASEGTGTADTTGIGTFVLEIPDVPTGAYQLSVTGTVNDDSDYDEGTQGLIVPASEDAPAPPEEDAPDDDGGAEEPPPGDDGSGVQPAPDTGTDTSGQVSSAPAGGVATGAGGTAGDGSTLPLVALTALLLAIVGHVVFRVRSHAVRDR